ncbi:zonular occludens toxin domain-containing protein [Acinetobacter ursingii]|uniref:zonular occludens toxin domain-containing protein n=1 Tax=Acinetobacter ursingii TaxID=108980 RepID=UPI002449C8A7|nr:zonular occludens toxin domain-containing protein [Acinetobacter ursingii]MDH2104284.1 zonular occludens toxin domain-containing protein [Acinetobacter ursingii]
MSIVVSAPIRTGKTLYCMQQIDKITKKEPHRRIYTNIVGCTYPGVILIQSTTDKPFDWRDLPNGSVLIYDECHEHPAFSKDDLLKTFEVDDSEYIKSIATINSNDTLKVKEKEELIRQEKKKQDMRLVKAKENILDIGRSLTLHGHFGIEIYFITQKPYKLNDSVKASVNEHLILRRLFKLKAATIYQFSELQEQFGRSTMKNALSWKFWFYPKQLYKFYISAEEHETSKKIPASLIFWLVLPVIIFGFAIYNTLGSKMFAPMVDKYFGTSFSKPKEQQTAQAAQSSSNAAATTSEGKEIDCNDLMNAHYQKCIAVNQERQNRVNQQVRESTAYYIDYNANDPYNTPNLPQYTATAQPVFSGCVKYQGKYYGYTQQGTKLNVTEHDCKRLIDQGDRPFNYFAKENNNAQPVSTNNQGDFTYSNQQYNSQNNSKMTPDQYARYLQYLDDQRTSQQAKNYVQPSLQRNQISGANAL